MAADLPELTFRRHGRRAETLAAMIACVAVMGLALAWGAPAIFYGPVALAIAVLGVVLKRNPVHGMRLTADALHLVESGVERVVPLDGIATARFTRWSDGPADLTLTLRDGRREELSSLGLPPAPVLAEALEARGVRVTRD
jgi:hypothetical protein